MEKKRKFKVFKSDVNDLIQSFNGDNVTPYQKETFLKWIDSCAEYTTAVIKHVAYAEWFKGNSSPSTRAEMEDLNRRRSEKHDNAIMRTLKIMNMVKKLPGDGSYFFLLNLERPENIQEAKEVKDLTGEQREELGQLFFQLTSVVASLTPTEVKEMGLESLKKDARREAFSYGVYLDMPTKQGYVKDADDIYEELR